MQTKQDNIPTQIPQVFKINGMNLVQVPSTQNSGLYKFKDSDGEIYLYERNELPASILKELTPLPTQVGNEVLHTQGEWCLTRDGLGIAPNIDAPVLAYVVSDNFFYTEQTAKSYAELICKAVNNYSKLIDENGLLKSSNKAAIKIVLEENNKLVESNRELLHISAKLLGVATLLFSTCWDEKNKEMFRELQPKAAAIIETAINNAKNL